MNKEERRFLEIKSLIILKGYKIKDIMIKFGYSSYDGLKFAIKENRKNMYFIIKKYLQN